MCAALLCLTLLPALAAGSGEVDVYQLVVNDQWFDVEELKTDTMPVNIGGLIYVPYTVFDKDVAGVDFKISYGQKRTDGEYTLTLYSLNGVLVFDLIRGTTVDGQGNALNMHAVLRNGKPFIPARAVCEYFTKVAGTLVVQYVYTSTDYGAIIRIWNSDKVLSDFQFKQSALGAMQTRYNKYIQSLNTPPSASGGVTQPTAAATPSPDDRTIAPVYLSFTCGEGDALEDILDTLNHNGASALFLFRPEELEANGALVRRIVGTGYPLGLIVTGTSLQAAGEALETGNTSLERIAWTRTRIAYVEESGGAAARQQISAGLEEDGWHCWSPTLSGTTGSTAADRAARVFSRIEGRRSPARVWLDDTSLSASTLTRLLSRFREENYSIRPPVETEF